MKSLKLKLYNYFLLIPIVLLVGCANEPTLYYWGSYENQVYNHFKGDLPEKQIAELEKILEQAKSKGQNLPPGFFAHLGFLYEKSGNSNKASAMFKLEKNTYPESTTLIDNINKIKK